MENKDINLNLDFILKKVCSHYSIDKSFVIGKSRISNVVLARQMYCYISRHFSKKSYSEIGALININHSSVIYSIKTIENDIVIYTKRREDLEKIKEMLLSKLIPSDIDLLQMSINYTNSFI